MQIKKTAAAAMCAVMMSSLAVPAIALAAESPSTVTDGPVTATTTSGEKVTLQIQYKGTKGSLIIEPTDQKAANVPSGTEPLANFKVYEATPGALCDENGNVPGGLLLTFGLQTSHAGGAATMYIDHDSGTDEVKAGTVSSSGQVSTNIDRLSIFSIVVDDSKKSSDSDSKKTDTSKGSPGTGTQTAPIAMMVTVGCLGGAAFCLRGARRKDEE